MQLPPTILSVDKPVKQGDSTKTSSKPHNVKLARNNPSSARPTPSVEKSAEDGEEPGLPDSDTDMNSDTDADQEELSENNMDVATPSQPVMITKKRPKGQRSLQPPHSLETTLFDRLEKLYGPDIKRMLNVQYRYVVINTSQTIITKTNEPRMHAQIAAFPSKVMYHNKLASHVSVSGHLLKDLPNTGASSEDENELLGTPVVFFDTAGCEYFERFEGDADEGSRCNENEAMVVKNYVEQLVCVYCNAVMLLLT